MMGLVLSLFNKQVVPFAAGMVSSIVLTCIIITDSPESSSASPPPSTDGRWVGCALVSVVVAALISLGLRCVLGVHTPSLTRHAYTGARLGYDHARGAVQHGYDRARSYGGRVRKRTDAIQDAYHRDLT